MVPGALESPTLHSIPLNMSLTSKQKKRFRTIGHQLKPIVTIAGKGLSENVMAEIERALTDHELMKIKVLAEDRDERSSLINEITNQCNATTVQTVGNIALLFRASAKPNPALSNLKRIEVF